MRFRDNRGHARLVLERVVAAGGQFRRRTKHGALYVLPGGGFILIPRGQRSGPRAKWNAMAELRRQLKVVR
jgi:hypothetical protein